MPRTRAQLAALMSAMYSEAGSYHIWIDMSKTASGEWEWGDGEQVLWADWKGEPDGKYDCVWISPYYNGLWSGASCDWTLWYMCQAGECVCLYCDV